MLNLPKYVFNFGYMINIDLSIRVVGEICNQPHQLTTESSAKALAVFFSAKTDRVSACAASTDGSIYKTNRRTRVRTSRINQATDVWRRPMMFVAAHLSSMRRFGSHKESQL